MSIEETVTRTVADVEITDEYRVALRTRKKLTDLSPDAAMALADELAEVAIEAANGLREDAAARGIASISHGFDGGPVHPECRDGKCRNCDGRTLNGRDEMVPCTHSCHVQAVAS